LNLVCGATPACGWALREAGLVKPFDCAQDGVCGKGNMKQDNQITIYETEDGKARIEVRFENENVWLTQKQMAELFDCSADNVSLHLKNIYTEKEVEPKSTTEEISVVQKEGQREVKRNITFEFRGTPYIIRCGAQPPREARGVSKGASYRAEVENPKCTQRAA